MLQLFHPARRAGTELSPRPRKIFADDDFFNGRGKSTEAGDTKKKYEDSQRQSHSILLFETVKGVDEETAIVSLAVRPLKAEIFAYIRCI